MQGWGEDYWSTGARNMPLGLMNAFCNYMPLVFPLKKNQYSTTGEYFLT